MLIRTTRLTIGWEVPRGTLILPISRPGVEPLIFPFTDDRAAHKSSGIADFLSHWGWRCADTQSFRIHYQILWALAVILKVLFRLRSIYVFEVKWWASAFLKWSGMLAAKREGEPGPLMTQCFFSGISGLKLMESLLVSFREIQVCATAGSTIWHVLTLRVNLWQRTKKTKQLNFRSFWLLTKWDEMSKSWGLHPTNSFPTTWGELSQCFRTTFGGGGGGGETQHEMALIQRLLENGFFLTMHPSIHLPTHRQSKFRNNDFG